jgi:hypothetical protein
VFEKCSVVHGEVTGRLTVNRWSVTWQHARMVDVSLNVASGGNEAILVLVKLQSPTWEVNFRATPDELARLEGIRDADWAARRCLQVGESAGSRVYWSADAEMATIMVGHDDETWDFAVTVPLACVDKIVTAAEACNW